LRSVTECTLNLKRTADVRKAAAYAASSLQNIPPPSPLPPLPPPPPPSPLVQHIQSLPSQTNTRNVYFSNTRNAATARTRANRPAQYKCSRVSALVYLLYTLTTCYIILLYGRLLRMCASTAATSHRLRCQARCRRSSARERTRAKMPPSFRVIHAAPAPLPGYCARGRVAVSKECVLCSRHCVSVFSARAPGSTNMTYSAPGAHR
jgi:hypothetical protein